MNTRFIIQSRVVALILSTLFAFAAPALASAPALVKLAPFKDKAGNTIRMSYTPSTRAQLEAFRPSRLMTEGAAKRQAIVAQCNAHKNPVMKFAKDYPPEAATFHMAVGASAGQQMVEDPAWARHFYEKSLLDPMSHVSFAGFMLGNRAAANFFQMAGWSHDPCRILKRNAFATLEELEAQKTSQKLFGIVAGPLAMGAGLIVSSEVQAFLSDPNVKLCAAYMIGKAGKPNKVVDLLRQVEPAKTQQEKMADPAKFARDACDHAYDEWVLNGGSKIRDLIPDMISQTGVAAIMGIPGAVKAISALVKNRKKIAIGESVEGAVAGTEMKSSVVRFSYAVAEKTFIFRGFSLLMKVGQLIPSPVTRVAVGVGNMVVFLELSDWVSPWTKPLHVFLNGKDIGDTMTAIHTDLTTLSKNKWVMPVVSHPSAESCTKTETQYGAHDWETLGSKPGCNVPAPEAPAAKIARLGEQERKYRDFIMGDTMGAVSSWQDYVLSFANSYTDARKFYRDILKRISGHAYRPGADPLYDAQSLWGVPVNTIDWDGKSICTLPQETVHRFDVAVTILKKEIARQKLPVVALPQLNYGINIDKNTSAPMPYLNLSGRKGTTNYFKDEHYDLTQLNLLKDGLEAMNCSVPQTNKNVTDASRLAKYNKAISSLYWQLAGLPSFVGSKDVFHSSMGLPSDAPAYIDAAQSNLFMQVNLVLGGPEPLYAGDGYVKAQNREGATINQDYKNVHPSYVGPSVGGVATNSMSDYLLASMVCGPAANQTIKAHTSVDITKTIPEMISAIPGLIRQGASYLWPSVRDRLPFIPAEIGWDIEFHPPRIINPIGVDVCNGNIAIKRIPNQGDAPDRAMIDAHMSVWKIKGKEYHGLLEIVKAFANKSIVGPDYVHFAFDQWWSENLDSQAIPLFENKRRQFAVDILNKKYIPALMSHERTTDKKWGIFETRGLAKGLLNSVLDSAQDNFAIMNSIVNVGADQKLLNELKATESEIVTRLHLGLMMVGPIRQLGNAIGLYARMYGAVAATESEIFDSTKLAAKKPEVVVHSASDSVAYEYFQANQKGLIQAQGKLHQLVADHINKRPNGVRYTLIPMLEAVLKNIRGLVTELDSLHGVVVSVQLEPAG